jgi:signal transduction histidine kinase
MGSRHDQTDLGDLGQSVLDAVPLGLYVVDRKYRVLAWNRMREAGPRGLPAAKAVGQPLSRVLPPLGYRSARRAIESVFRTGMAVEESLATPSGRFHVRRIPVGPAAGVTHVLSCFENVTDRQELDLRLVASDRWAFLGQIVAGVAHEISNPLAGIAGCAEALATLAAEAGRDKAKTEARRFRDLIRSEVSRSEALVRFLLESARPEEGSATDVRAAVLSSLRLLERHPSFARVKVRTSLLDSPSLAQIPPEALKQSVVAVLARAGTSMPAGGSLSVTLRRERRRIALDFSDSGIPVGPEAVGRLFDPWDGSPGAGLGLAVARSLLRRHGGDLEVHPRRAGTRLRMTLEALGRKA